MEIVPETEGEIVNVIKQGIAGVFDDCLNRGVYARLYGFDDFRSRCGFKGVTFLSNQ